MEGFEFGSCTKRYLDTIQTYTKKTIKLIEYCNTYAVNSNFIKIYFLKMNEHNVVMWFLIIVIIIVAVVLTKRLLDLFLAKFVISIKKRHDLSPVFVGAVFLPICYQLKDLFYFSSGPRVEPFDLYYMLTMNISCYFHYLCVPFAFLLLKDAKTEHLPRGFVNTSLAFILAIIIFTEFIGIYADIDYWVSVVYFTIGVLYYIFVGFMVPKYNKRRLAEREKWEKVDNYTQEIEEIDREINQVVFKEQIDITGIKKRKIVEKQHKSVLYRIMKQIWNPELDLINNLIQSPIIIASLFTTPYPKNPMMKTILRYPIVTFGTYFTMNTTFYTGSLIFEISTTLLVLLIYVLMERFSDKKNVKTFIELISIVQAQAILILITNTIGDAIFYIPFSLSMNRTSVNVVWTSLRVVYPRVMYGYIFLKNGEFMVLAVSYFSCWIFQMTFMFSKTVATNVFWGNKIFSLFGSKDKFLAMPFGFGVNSQKFMMYQMVMFVSLVIVQLYYFNGTRGPPNKNFARSMLVVWLLAMGYSMYFGLFEKS